MDKRAGGKLLPNRMAARMQRHARPTSLSFGCQEGDGFLEPPGEGEERGIERVAVGARVAAADQVIETEARMAVEDFGSSPPSGGSSSR